MNPVTLMQIQMLLSFIEMIEANQGPNSHIHIPFNLVQSLMALLQANTGGAPGTIQIPASLFATLTGAVRDEIGKVLGKAVVVQAPVVVPEPVPTPTPGV